MYNNKLPTYNISPEPEVNVRVNRMSQDPQADGRNTSQIQQYPSSSLRAYPNKKLRKGKTINHWEETNYPAFGKRWRACNRNNHFPCVCRSARNSGVNNCNQRTIPGQTTKQEKSNEPSRAMHQPVRTMSTLFKLSQKVSKPSK